MSSLKRTLAFLLIIGVLLICVCCDKPEGESDFTDSLGRGVSLSGEPMRVAVLFSSLAEVWQLAGGEVSVSVGESVERGFCGTETPLVHSDSGGVGKSINTELLLGERPDFVICTSDYPEQVKLENILESAGIPVAYFRLESFDDYLYALKIMTNITGDSEAYERYGCAVLARIEAILSDLPDSSPRVMFARATKSSLKAKLRSDHFAANMLYELGAYNVAEDAAVLLDGVSIEALLTENPDFIFISLMGDAEGAVSYVEGLFERPEWRELDAVKNKRYIFLPKELFQYKPCASWDLAYQELYDYLYE